MIFSPHVNENGVRVKRTPQTHPYSYEEFIVHRKLSNEHGNQTLWSDRLRGFYPDKWSPLVELHLQGSDDFSAQNPDQIESFLKALLDNQNLELVYVMQGCNPSNGYAYWRFLVKADKKENGCV